jgi:Spy/CpxP family protein refolding chaperone
VTRPFAWISVLALFLSGISIGGLAVHLYYGGADRVALPPPPPGLEGRFDDLREALDLTPEQAREIAAIRERGRREADALREELRPRIERHLEQMRERVLAVLTPEQRARFEALERERPRRRSPLGRPFGEGHGRDPGRRPPEPPPGP